MLRDLAILAYLRIVKVPAVGHLHGGRWRATYEGATHLEQWLIRAGVKAFRYIMVLSPGLVEQFSGLLPPGRIAVVGNAVVIPPRACRSLLEDVPHPIVLFFGNLTKTKGIDAFVECIKLAHDEGLNWRFCLAGEDAEVFGEPINAALTARGLDNAEYLGVVSGKEKWDLLSVASVMVLPSQAEGEPMAVLESLGAGTPVIATPVGAIPEVAMRFGGVSLFGAAQPTGSDILCALHEFFRSQPQLKHAAAMAETQIRDVRSPTRHVDAVEALLRSVITDDASLAPDISGWA